METKQHSSHNQWVSDEIMQEIKQLIKLMKIQTQHTGICGTQ